MSVTIKSNRLDLVAGIILLLFVILFPAWFLGWATLSIFRDTSIGYSVTIPPIMFVVYLPFLSYIINLYVFSVSLEGAYIHVGRMLQCERVVVNEKSKLYFCDNIKYSHIIISNPTEISVISSALWSRKAFMALMTEVSTWAITAGHAEPIKIDLIDGNKQWKTLNVKLNWWLWRRELPSYAVFFATLVGLSALVQAAFSSVFGGHQ